ncbi:hypothetical protein AB1Y20_009787 [Prymnesium parvum]|uniref:Uncharacterized protein n=1 Tax=Prymnesium parvum TaxID=97485 RepID=A0AB34K309_PRYPA
MPARGRDFRCHGVNATTAREHEESFASCVKPAFSEANQALSHQLLRNASRPLPSTVEWLLSEYPVQVCACTRFLDSAVSCGHSSAEKVLEVYRPWCFMIAQCEDIASSLLRSAAYCQNAGMTGNNETALCTNGECAKSVEYLFSVTHTLSTEWHNVSTLLSSLHVPSFDWLFGNGVTSFGHLSGCMARVNVKEEQLRLPMSLAALSGNGSFVSFSDLFRDKCQSDYWFQNAVLLNANFIPGFGAAKVKWEEGNTTAALLIVLATIAVALIMLFCLARCVRRGNCYKLCSPSSVEEREALNDDADRQGDDPSQGEGVTK